MDSRNQVESRDTRRAEKQPQKKPYRKPAFQFERVFETQALSCAKINVNQRICHFNPKAS